VLAYALIHVVLGGALAVGIGLTASGALFTSSSALSREADARNDLRGLQQSIALYALERGDCPDVLEALATRGLVDGEPIVDPWGQPFDYRCVNAAGGRHVTLASHGPDKTRGTPDDLTVQQHLSW
jgi:hypothetical protein